MSDQVYTIADLPFELSAGLSLADLGIADRLMPFGDGQAGTRDAVSIVWQGVTARPRSAGQLVFDPGSIWRMYRCGDQWEAEIHYVDAGGCLLTTDDGWSRLVIREQLADGQASLLGLGAGELALRGAMAARDGLVLHSAGIDDNGRGIVFVGHSGAGKSTMCGWWDEVPGAVAMNDDRIALRPTTGGGWRCYGTPWGGTADIARAHAAPLAAVVVLEQHEANAIEPLDAAAALSRLLPRSFAPYWDRSLLAAWTARLARLVGEVPIYLLRCRREAGVVDVVRSVL